MHVSSCNKWKLMLKLAQCSRKDVTNFDTTNTIVCLRTDNDFFLLAMAKIDCWNNQPKKCALCAVYFGGSVAAAQPSIALQTFHKHSHTKIECHIIWRIVSAVVYVCVNDFALIFHQSLHNDWVWIGIIMLWPKTLNRFLYIEIYN